MTEQETLDTPDIQSNKDSQDIQLVTSDGRTENQGLAIDEDDEDNDNNNDIPNPDDNSNDDDGELLTEGNQPEISRRDSDVYAINFDEKCWCPKCDFCGCYEQKKCCFSLTHATIVAALIGFVIGLIIQKSYPNGVGNITITLLGFPGMLWIRALKLLVLPLLSLMMLTLPSSVKDVNLIAKTALPFFIITSTLAAIQGTIWVNIIKPGKHGSVPDIPPEDTSNTERINELDAILAIFTNAVPPNIISAMAELKVLGVICFFMLFGVLLRDVREKDRNIVIGMSNALLKCTMIAISYVIQCTPIGMLSMVAVKIVGTSDFFSLLKALGMYLVTAIIGHTIHILLILPILFLIITKFKYNPWIHFIKIIQSPLVAFATSSSAATLPVSREVAEKAGVSQSVLSFVLPLGSAINMDGTALGFPIMIMFIAQLYNREMSFGQQISIMLLSMVISIGTAPVPNAGMVYLIMLLDAANMNDIANDAIATLFILDWIIDRIETAVNVTSDQYITKMVDSIQERRNKKNDQTND